MKLQKRENLVNEAVQTKKRRQPWIELLRIIAILLIVLGHFNDHQPEEIKYVLPEMGQMGVILFFMISGWCNVMSSKYRFSKFFVQLIINVFWGLIFAIVLYYTGLSSFNPFQVLFGCAIQSEYSTWWFLWIYFVITLLQVPLNMFIQKTNKWLSFWIIIIVLLCWIFMRNQGVVWDYINPERILYGVVFYSLAGWISYYYKQRLNVANPQHKWPVLAILLVASLILYGFYCPIFAFFCSQGFYSLSIDYLLIIMLIIPSIIWLLFCDNLPWKCKEKCPLWEKIILFLANQTLPIYLYHSMFWVVLDKIFNVTNCMSILNQHYWGKFIIYLFIGFILCILMHMFINIQEKAIWRLINSSKNKKNEKVGATA